MSRTRIHNLAISLDGFATREPQSWGGAAAQPAPSNPSVSGPP